MNNMAGLSSYDKVESMQAYEMTDEELMGYCVLKMESAQSNAAFIEERIFTGGVSRTAGNMRNRRRERKTSLLP